MHQHMNTHRDVQVMFIIWLVLGKRLSCRSEVMEKDFMAKEEIGPLVKERGLTEVQKQRKYQMNTLDKDRNNKRQLCQRKEKLYFLSFSEEKS